MTDKEAFAFISAYFHDLFDARDLSALDRYLSPDYFDDDIGPSCADHVGNSRRYLSDWFSREPTVGVTVNKAMISHDVISADLEWHTGEDIGGKTLMRGVACFVIRDGRITHRHTFMYFKARDR